MTKSTEEILTASGYLSHAYDIPDKLPGIPMPDEPFVRRWREGAGREALDFLTDVLKLPAYDWSWDNIAAISVSFAWTMGGKLPVISTDSHKDFRQMEALLNAREVPRELPPTVNAFAFEARAGRKSGASRASGMSFPADAESILGHRVLLLNYAPYSNIPAEKLGLVETEWLELSHKLRLRHECAHYETLRLLGGMRNHAYDEILADALGQLAAFGRFDAERQRLFFGLERGTGTCKGRLSFYCQKLPPQEREKVYRAVDMVLDSIEEELDSLLAQHAEELDIFIALAGKSIAARMERCFVRPVGDV